MTYRNTERRRVDGLIQRSEIAGFLMPEPVLAAIRKEDGLREAHQETREQISKVPTAHDVVSQLRAEGGLPANFTKTLASWRDKAATLKEQDRLLSVAIEEQEEAVASAVANQADTIIRTQLQPALARLVSQVREHASAYPNIPWDDFDAAMRLDDPAAREAYQQVKSATERYQAIRDALRLLYGERQLELRHEVKNLREVWPNFQFRAAANRPPWPSNREARLAWLATHGADLWAPTSDEADAEELRQIALAKKRSALPANSATAI